MAITITKLMASVQERENKGNSSNCKFSIMGNIKPLDVRSILAGSFSLNFSRMAGEYIHQDIAKTLSDMHHSITTKCTLQLGKALYASCFDIPNEQDKKATA